MLLYVILLMLSGMKRVKWFHDSKSKINKNLKWLSIKSDINIVIKQ